MEGRLWPQQENHHRLTQKSVALSKKQSRSLVSLATLSVWMFFQEWTTRLTTQQAAFSCFCFFGSVGDDTFPSLTPPMSAVGSSIFICQGGETRLRPGNQTWNLVVWREQHFLPQATYKQSRAAPFSSLFVCLPAEEIWSSWLHEALIYTEWSASGAHGCRQAWLMASSGFSGGHMR